MILAVVASLFLGWMCGYLHYEQRSKTRAIQSYNVEIKCSSNQDPQKIAKAFKEHLNHLRIVK